MDTQILEDLGFTNAEIKIYLSLLELGNASAGPIIEKTGLQSSVVHMTLNKLINKGFVSFVKEGQRKYYQATNPKHISYYIEDKKREFEKILPELLQKRDFAKEKTEIVSYRGKKGIRELFYELLEAGGKEHNTFGSPKDSLMMGDAFWANFHKRRTEKKIKAKLLFNESLRDWCSGYSHPLAEVRFIKENVEPLTETIIRNDKVAMVIWTENPVGVIIHNKKAAQSYEEFFKILWKKGSPKK